MMNDAQRLKLKHILSKVGDVSFRRRVLKILEYLDVEEGDCILDCGCGEGFYTMIIHELFGNSCVVVSVDLDCDLVRRARSWLGRDNISRFMCANVTHLPLRSDIFDKVIFSEVLEHIEDEQGVLSEIKRVVKKDGVIALTVPNHNYPLLWDPCNKIREALGLGHFSLESGFWGGLWAMHLRLYYLTHLEAIVTSTGFSIVERVMITHYSLPFNHMILYVGKRLGKIFPIPQSITKSMEKFAWKEPDKGFFAFLIQCFMKIINWIDAKNDGVETEFSKSSVCIGLKLHK